MPFSSCNSQDLVWLHMSGIPNNCGLNKKKFREREPSAGLVIPQPETETAFSSTIFCMSFIKSTHSQMWLLEYHAFNPYSRPKKRGKEMS